MVATLVRLRWSIVLHQLRRDWWRLLFVVAGAVWSLSIVPSVVFAVVRLGKESYDVRHDALVAIATLIAVAWVALPLLATGVDDALDPARFAPWGVSARRLMPGLTVAAFTTVPAAFFVAVAVVLAMTWRGITPGPLPLLGGLLGAIATAVTWVFSARLVTLWGARFLVRRGSKLILAAGAAVGISVFADGVIRLRREGLDQFLQADMAVVVDQLSRTPLAAGFAAPASLAESNPWGMWWRLLMTCAWAVLLWLAWRDAVAFSMTHPVTKATSSIRGDDAVASAVSRPSVARLSARRVVAAVTTRTVRSWRSDPRYIAQALGSLVLPVLLGGVAIAVAGQTGPWIASVPMALAVSIGWGRHNDLAYDGSALWLDLVAGVKGVYVARGRMLGTAVWAVPVVLAASLAAAGLSQRWDLAVAITASSLGALGTSLAVAATTSVLIAYPVPTAGDSPFGQGAGSIGASLVGQVLSSAGTSVVVPLTSLPLAAAIVWGGPWQWVAIVTGLALGPAALWWGTTAAGALFDRRTGTLLGAVS